MFELKIKPVGLPHTNIGDYFLTNLDLKVCVYQNYSWIGSYDTETHTHFYAKEKPIRGGHLPFGLELGTGVHRQAAGTATESVTLGSVLAAVAIFAVQLVLVLGAVGRVEHLAAHS